MTTLKAHAIFLAIPLEDRRMIPAEVHYKGVDVWAAASVAALRLAGHLDSAETSADLINGIDAFNRMYIEGLVDWPAWQSEIKAVLQEVMDWGQQFEQSIGGLNGLN